MTNNDVDKIGELLRKELEGQKPLYVLYIDDELDLLDSLAPIIADFGFTPILTVDPKVALQKIIEHRVDLALIISDLRMPTMNGFDLREEITKIAPEVPFAILSAHINTEIAMRGVELKICAFIAKPIHVSKFVEVMSRETLARVQSVKEDRELRAGFISESENLLLDGETLLLAIDENPKDIDTINRFFGIIHTLKGASGFFEPKTFHRVAHRYEDILKKIQRLEIEVDSDISRVLFHGFDLLKELMSEFRTDSYKTVDLDQLLSSLDISKIPQKNTNEIKSGSPDTAPETNIKDPPRVQEDVKVSVALLDEFIQLSGEVTVIRNMLNKCVRTIERQYSGDKDVAMVAELLNELHKINGGVQNKISEIRKVPIKSVIKAIPRAVRDVSKQINKQVDLQIAGEEVRVDTSIASVLNNSLLHIIKNSMDHGLETTEERARLGKPEKGLVSLKFSNKNDSVIVEIEDDGQGLNEKAIKAKLLKNESHTQQQIDEMTKSEIYSMIFASGFSTANQVTAISGRGVGMSMVKDSVEAMGGEIQIESTPGVGAKFRLILPIPKSVLIASCLSVRSGGLQVGLIQDDILRVLQFDNGKAEEFIRELSGARVLLFEGDLTPLTTLQEIMGIKTPQPQANQSNSMRCIVVMHSAQDGRRIAVEVDEVFDVEDTVIKLIHSTLNPKEIYRGITFLDDGTLGLIMSTTGILDSLKITRGTDPSKNLTTESDAEKIKRAANLALLFRLPIAGSYAMRMGDIHRIEQIQESSITRSGQTFAIPYRGGILEICDLSSLFDSEGQNGKSAPQSNKDSLSEFPLIVVPKGNGYLGIQVKAVEDMVQFDEIHEDLADPTKGIEGHFFWNEQGITLFSLEQILQILAKK